jgi:hypothetical protein
LFSAASLHAASAPILIEQNISAVNIGPTGSDKDFKKALLNLDPGSGNDFADAHLTAAANAILFVYRNPRHTDSAPDITSLTLFLLAGGRVPIIGEGNFLDTWIISFASAIAGGSLAAPGVTFNRNAAPVVFNDAYGFDLLVLTGE